MEQVYDALTTATDSVCVHAVGFTLTLYRYAADTQGEHTYQIFCCQSRMGSWHVQGQELAEAHFQFARCSVRHSTVATS